MKSLILAGGKGTRLWPMSTEKRPKQFLKIIGNKSLLQQTIERAINFSTPEDIHIVTIDKYKQLVKEQLNELNYNVPHENIILEPEGKNTLPATLLSSLKINEKYGENTKLGVFPSDHLIEVDKDYRKAINDAPQLSENYLVTFGVEPSSPHTGYGYIKPGEELENGFKVDKFVEKPDIQKAKEYINNGYYWNSGKFLFNVDIFLDECKKHYPKLLGDVESFEDLKSIYDTLPNASIDEGIMEKTDKGAVKPITSYWNDIGSYDALHKHLNKDSNNNVIKGPCQYLESENNFVKSDKPVVNIGVDNIVLVETEDVILVCSKDKSGELKKFVKNNNVIDGSNE